MKKHVPVIVTVRVSENINILGTSGKKTRVYTREVYADNDWGSHAISDFVATCRRQGSPHATQKRVSVWIAPIRLPGYDPASKAVAKWQAYHFATNKVVELEAHYAPHRDRKWYRDGSQVNLANYALIRPGA